MTFDRGVNGKLASQLFHECVGLIQADVRNELGIIRVIWTVSKWDYLRVSKLQKGAMYTLIRLHSNYIPADIHSTYHFLVFTHSDL